MELLLDPTIWGGLATLIILEIVLGIDNLIFIAILSGKLPPNQRHKARVMGLSLALLMRIVLLICISSIMKLTAPIFNFMEHDFSWRDLIMVIGGGFLLFKGTIELHEKLESVHSKKEVTIHYAKFWSVIVQIVVLDAIFSLDAVVTAIGMSDHLMVMIIAVIIAMILMILASNKLMDFVIAHPTAVILCLGFLLMIGFSLIIEGFGYHIPKGYLYAAIGFSVAIEALNQLAHRNKQKSYEKIDARTRVSQAVIGLLGIRNSPLVENSDLSALQAKNDELNVFKPQERMMIQRVLQLSEQLVGAIMTPRNDIYHIDLSDDYKTLEKEIYDCPYSSMIVIRDGNINEPSGVLLKKDLSDFLMKGHLLQNVREIVRQPLIIPENMTVLQVMDTFQKGRIHTAFVVDEYGTFEGFITLTDIVEAIAGDMPEEHDEDLFRYKTESDGSIIISGNLTTHELNELLGDIELPEGDYNTVAGVALNALKRIPKSGDAFILSKWLITITEMDGRRISKMRFSEIHPHH